jgi:exosortase
MVTDARPGDKRVVRLTLGGAPVKVVRCFGCIVLMSNRAVMSAVKLPFLAIDWMKVVLGLVLAGLVYYAYWVQPIGTDLSVYGWLVSHWRNTSNYSHGPLIPLIAAGLVWWKRRVLFQATIRPAAWGAVVVAAAVLLYYAAIKAVEPRTAVFSFIVLLYGLVLALAGRAVFRVLFFPITFLLLMIPLNFLEEQVGFRLQLLMAQLSTTVLNGIGIDAWQSGTAIHAGVFPYRSGLFDFEVAAPCSGIRSLMALTTVTAAYAYVTQTKQWKRWLLFLSAMPLAVLGNLVRVTSTGLIAQVFGQQAAIKTYHDYSGYIVFAVALSAMVAFGLLLDFPYRRVFEKWLRPAPKHTESLAHTQPAILPKETHE